MKTEKNKHSRDFDRGIYVCSFCCYYCTDKECNRYKVECQLAHEEGYAECQKGEKGKYQKEFKALMRERRKDPRNS